MRFIISFLILLRTISIFAQEDIRTNLSFSVDHYPQKDVPKGELKGPFDFYSQIIPETVRQYWLFIPAQYDGTEAASILVFQDGYRAQHPKGSINAPQVLENLIANGDIPVTIGLFISPGNRSTVYPDSIGWSNPNNRMQEYDAMDNRYGRFIIEEMLPEIEKDYKLTQDPKQRAIGGTSSGAIAAFTVAWHYPEVFQKVFSSIGSYVSLGFKPDETPIKLGGQDYPALIRRENIRPLRIYLHDGTNDINNEWGDWFLANQQMVSAMNWANNNADRNKDPGSRYELNVVWTDGEHNDKHAGVLLPEALRWLWKD